jgi:hypothetical protein
VLLAIESNVAKRSNLEGYNGGLEFLTKSR